MSEENTTVTHIQQNGRYRMQIERSATKGIDGFKVEVNGDDIATVRAEVEGLYTDAKHITFTEPIK